MIRHYCHDYISKIQKQFENISKRYNIFIANIYLVKW